MIDFSHAYAPSFWACLADTVAATKADELAEKTIGVTYGALEDMELSKIAQASPP